MKEVTISLNCDCINDIVRADITSIRNIMESDLKRRENGSDKYGVFHLNKKKDIAEMKKHIKAFDIVLKYYSVPSK